MLTMKHLIRAAERLRSAWLTGPAQNKESSAMLRWKNSVQGLRVVRHRLLKARKHGLELILPQLIDDFRFQLRAVQDAVQSQRDCFDDQPPEIPSFAFFVAELRQLEEDFGQVQVRWDKKSISVTTESITLRGVYLGPFSIRLFWETLRQAKDIDAFGVVALDPNPAATNERVTHPHVCDGALCAGDASAPLRKAMVQGRVADAFCLIRSVLTHYNSLSPHVSLEAWSGVECHDCGCAISERSQYFCADCDYDYCEDCASSCSECGATRCKDCISCCNVCDGDFCLPCLERSSPSGRLCCKDCLEACPSCGKLLPNDELAAETRLCVDCAHRRRRDGNALLPATYSPSPESEVHDESLPDAIEA